MVGVLTQREPRLCGGVGGDGALSSRCFPAPPAPSFCSLTRPCGPVEAFLCLFCAAGEMR